MTAVVRTKEASIAPNSIVLWLFKAKMDFLWDRILKEWKISAIDIVRNAIVTPCSGSPWDSTMPRK